MLAARTLNMAAQPGYWTAVGDIGRPGKMASTTSLFIDVLHAQMHDGYLRHDEYTFLINQV
ncbi:hypothetical protein LPH44_08550 [Xylella taiwanensis]|uniref:Uncharacterized protein n=2 Tax=Xylella taiwanensis TaxID=1444770 RepID=Z9JII3_9GAMM|nr:hypothetical protein [Xylella taiwanensis]AXI83969.1 hypothetical protein AB672_08490 [Xylella taiwanensis]EWS77828.1 hypothetical protein AF72_08605 [Xylella taiwanensis]MCD8457075.1 hypothetical protein [Xylella taiwanensis]MCD8466109.1 hypothetical protein [Xylella taiwanensis]MCD8468568.1 hypothetical protein [Xylella taiwanensis]